MRKIIDCMQQHLHSARKKGNRAENFSEGEIVECSILQGFKRVLDIDKDTNIVYLYDLDDSSDVFGMDAEFIRKCNTKKETVNILYASNN